LSIAFPELTLTNPGWAPGLSPPLQLAVIEQAVAFLSFNLPRGAPSSDAANCRPLVMTRQKHSPN
jgi:hypothetical protein